MRSEHLQDWIREETQEKDPHTTVGVTGKFEETGIPRVSPPSGADMDDDGDNTKSWRGVYRDRFSRIYLEFLCLHHEQPATFLHHHAQYAERVNIGDSYRDSNLGGQSVSADRGDIP